MPRRRAGGSPYRRPSARQAGRPSFPCRCRARCGRALCRGANRNVSGLQQLQKLGHRLATRNAHVTQRERRPLAGALVPDSNSSRAGTARLTLRQRLGGRIALAIIHAAHALRSARSAFSPMFACFFTHHLGSAATNLLETGCPRRPWQWRVPLLLLARCRRARRARRWGDPRRLRRAASSNWPMASSASNAARATLSSVVNRRASAATICRVWSDASGPGFHRFTANEGGGIAHGVGQEGEDLVGRVSQPCQGTGGAGGTSGRSSASAAATGSAGFPARRRSASCSARPRCPAGCCKRSASGPPSPRRADVLQHGDAR